MKRFEHRQKLNNMFDMKDNKGSATVTVLVAFLFVSVLVSIVLATVSVNLKMRGIDRKAKDEFYYCEKALNDIYTGLGIECSDILGETYNKVLANELGNAGYDIEKEKVALARFNTIFTKEVYDLIKDAASGGRLEKKLKGYIVGDRAELVNIPKYEVIIGNADGTETIKTESDPINDADYANIKSIVLKNVIIKSNTASAENTGYVSAITTDIVIETPTPDFITVNKKWINYAVIANEGIDFQGNTSIEGNVYGGTKTTTQIRAEVLDYKNKGKLDEYSSRLYGGINIYGGDVKLTGDYIVSGGDINVLGDGSKLTISNNGSESQSWFESLRIKAKNSNVAVGENVSMYALNDLEMGNGSEGSEFSITKGNYYGYNAGKFDLRKDVDISKESLFRADDNTNKDAESSNSSAIILNSKDARIDFGGVNTLVLLGKAYINHSSKAPSIVIASGNDSDFYTLESAGLKGNQEVYLVPEEFLGVSNPVSGDINVNPFADSINIPTTWFGTKYLDSPEYKTVFVRAVGGTPYAYCYLNFKSDDARKEYLKTVLKKDKDNLNGKIPVSPTGEELFGRMMATDEKQNSELIIGGPKSHIYADSVLIQYLKAAGGAEAELKEVTQENENKYDRFVGYSSNMLHKYRWLDTYLDPQADRSLTQIDKSAPEDGVQEVKTLNYPLDETKDSDYTNSGLPLSRIVWIGKNPSADGNSLPGITHPGVRQMNNNQATDDTSLPAEEQLPGKVLISKTDCDVTGTSTNFVICDGDVTVKKGAKVDGFIYATGKVIFEGGIGGPDENRVTFNSALFEQRIDKEIENVKNALNDRVKKHSAYKDYYLISYLLDVEPEKNGIASTTDNPIARNDLLHYYNKEEGSSTKVNTDYRRFISYDNWKKGQIKQ